MAANRFDALRLLFAATVAVYHLVVLASLAPGSSVERLFAEAAHVSIQGFFIISGALVLGSWERSASWRTYLEKRVRRLYPAYAVIILVPTATAVLMGRDLMGIAHYLGANLVFLNFLAPTLPGVFEGQRFEAVNGALWTLKIEVLFYAALLVLAPCLVWARRRGWALWFLIGLGLGGEAWRLAFLTFAPPEQASISAILARQLPGQMAFFAGGMALWVFRHSLKSRTAGLGLIGLVCLAAGIVVPEGIVLRPLGLSLLVAFAAWHPGPQIPAARHGDISYGIYICHFPIIQMLVSAGVFETSPAFGALAASGLTLGAACLLWRFVEKPALRADSHYRTADRIRSPVSAP
ncbi:MAG: acyltransferase [Pseudomonadota bacterium]